MCLSLPQYHTFFICSSIISLDFQQPKSYPLLQVCPRMFLALFIEYFGVLVELHQFVQSDLHRIHALSVKSSALWARSALHLFLILYIYNV